MMQGKPDTWLKFLSVNELRTYLENNHQILDGFWLEIKKAKSNLLGIRLYEAVETALCFGWIDGRMYSLGEDAIIIYLSKRRKNSVWSLVNKRRILALIEDGSVTEAGFASIEIAKQTGSWQEAYTSKTTLDNSTIFLNQLNLDAKAYQVYQSLTNIEQLRILMWVEQCRSETSLHKRINDLIRLLKEENKQEILMLVG